MGHPYHGFIHSYVHQGRIGVLVEFGVETDFATRTPEFVRLAHDVAMHIAGMSPADVEALVAQPFARNPTFTVGAVLAEANERLRETIVVRRFVRWDVGRGGDQHPLSFNETGTPPKNSAGIAF